MNEKNELKILREFLKIVENPAEAEKKFIRYTKTAMLISILLIFYCLSDNVNVTDQKYLLLICAFISGAFFGLGIWFLQAATQTTVMVKHMSKDSINNRINEINNKKQQAT